MGKEWKKKNGEYSQECPTVTQIQRPGKVFFTVILGIRN